jgi:hypothetical protein
MLVALVGGAFMTAITLAYAGARFPEGDVVIATTRAFTKPMTFSHSKHKEYRCDECHHDYDKGKNVWREGQEVKLCNACHPLNATSDIMCLEKAYHDKCVTCHKKLKKEDKKTGPTSCSKCHMGAAGQSEAK